DSPEHIINHSIEEHLKLLTGFGSNLKTNDHKKEELKDVRHVALSLTGEPITYPLINEILDGFHKRRISTFLVTNAQFPNELEKIKHVTQLYLSIDAPTKEKLKEIDRPLFKDYWERMNKCLDLLSTRRYRTCIRLSLIKYENMENFEEYAKLISKGSPDFVELKSYMWVGESQKNYKVENMPYMEDMKIFMENILEFLPGYEFLSSHESSRAILLGKKSLNKKHWINFSKFFELVNSKKDYVAEDYSSEVMQPNK
ncbi:4-demethylwyosine synthase TYW1, partial [Candidatus Pacearchaeota archaeon CG09_land_8_20_14_0_10_30_9]